MENQRKGHRSNTPCSVRKRAVPNRWCGWFQCGKELYRGEFYIEYTFTGPRMGSFPSLISGVFYCFHIFLRNEMNVSNDTVQVLQSLRQPVICNLSGLYQVHDFTVRHFMIYANTCLRLHSVINSVYFLNYICVVCAYLWIILEDNIRLVYIHLLE